MDINDIDNDDRNAEIERVANEIDDLIEYFVLNSGNDKHVIADALELLAATTREWAEEVAVDLEFEEIVEGFDAE